MFGIKNFSKNKKAFGKTEIAEYIYDSVDTPILVVDENQKLIMGNDSAKTFFALSDTEEETFFNQLFEITEEDSVTLFKNIVGDVRKEECQLIAKPSGAICKVFITKFLEENDGNKCMVVYVNNMTSDYQMIENLKQVNSALEEELKNKTKQVETVALQAVTTIANFIDSKEEYSFGHSTRVAKYAEHIAREMGWSQEEALNIHYVALLHDIGKIGVPIQILNKKSPLTLKEQKMVEEHTRIGAEILKDIKTVSDVSVGALYHHERYDGSGYPEGRSGQEIPLIARIIAIADAYDAMTSKREYKEIMSEEDVCKEIARNAGAQFDPYIASVVVRMINEGIFEGLKDKSAEVSVDNIIVESNALMAKVMAGDLESSKAEAENDYLTQIWNRRIGERHITEYLGIGDGALMIIDLDNFKHVNDTYGHLSGDHVLKQVADILRVHGKSNYVCRMAGDEFLLFIRDAMTIEETKPLLDSIMYSFNSRKQKDEILACTSLSIGIALSAVEGRDYNQLFRCADRALYYVKQNGKGGYSFHNRTEFGGAKNTKVDLERLVNAIKAKGQTTGAFRVEYEQFMQIHNLVDKFAKRNHQKLQLVLLTIDFDNSIPMEVEERDMVMKELENSVSRALRGVDISTRFSSAQLLIILVGATTPNVPMAIQRMLKEFYHIYRPTEVKVSFETADITSYD